MPSYTPATCSRPGRSGRPTLPDIVRGEGCRLFDADGKRYLDFSAGLVAVNLGPRTSRLARSDRRAGKPADVSRRRAWATIAARNSREAIVQIAPWDGSAAAIFFTTGGGEANEDAHQVRAHDHGPPQSAHRVPFVSRFGARRGNAHRREPPLAQRAGHSGRRAFLRTVSVSQPVPHARSARRSRARDRASGRHRRRTKAATASPRCSIEPVVGSNGVMVYPRRLSRKACASSATGTASC